MVQHQFCYFSKYPCSLDHFHCTIFHQSQNSIPAKTWTVLLYSHSSYDLRSPAQLGLGTLQCSWKLGWEISASVVTLAHQKGMAPFKNFGVIPDSHCRWCISRAYSSHDMNSNKLHIKCRAILYQQAIQMPSPRLTIAMRPLNLF